MHSVPRLCIEKVAEMGGVNGFPNTPKYELSLCNTVSTNL